MKFNADNDLNDKFEEGKKLYRSILEELDTIKRHNYFSGYDNTDTSNLIEQIKGEYISSIIQSCYFKSMKGV